MNLNNYYQLQRILDFSIEQKFDLEPNEIIFDKLLALVVEIGEASNEHRGFKFWSEDQQPRRKIAVECPSCEGEGLVDSLYGDRDESCLTCNGSGRVDDKNPLLEEFVDAWHFGISIGISLDIHIKEVNPVLISDTTKLTLRLISWVTALAMAVDMDYNKSIQERRYKLILEHLLGLGMAYGFTEDEIEVAYLEKNKINHQRQLNGY